MCSAAPRLNFLAVWQPLQASQRQAKAARAQSFKFASVFMSASKLDGWPWQFVGKAAHCSLVRRDDPHAVRRLRHRAWLIIGQEMRPLQHALLWA